MLVVFNSFTSFWKSLDQGSTCETIIFFARSKFKNGKRSTIFVDSYPNILKAHPNSLWQKSYSEIKLFNKVLLESITKYVLKCGLISVVRAVEVY